MTAAVSHDDAGPKGTQQGSKASTQVQNGRRWRTTITKGRGEATPNKDPISVEEIKTERKNKRQMPQDDESNKRKA